jgi:SpoIID/LytB domain protein
MRHTTRLASALAGAAALLLTLVLPTTVANADQSVAVPVVRLDGRGHGHGVGMSQWGAFTMARSGASSADIIGAFYPGTALGTAGGEVVVVVDRRDRVRIGFPGGGELRSSRSGAQAAGFPVRVGAGGMVEIVREPGGYRVVGGQVTALQAGTAARYSSSPQDCVLVVCSPDDDEQPAPTTTTPDGGDGSDDGDGDPTAPEPGPAPSPEPAAPAPAPATTTTTTTTTAPPPEPSSAAAVSPTPVWAVPTGGATVQALDRGRTYRGVLEATGPQGAMRLRNHVDIESYLKGMAEVPGTWPAAAVQAQAIAARTYALRAMAAGGEICDSESCQVYAGTAHETPGQVAAVDATRNVVVTHGGRLAATFYSASGGGFSATVAEGFGSGNDVPYLQAKPYPNARDDSWSVAIALDDVGQRLGYPGTVRTVRVDEVGPSGRPLRMSIDGDAGVVGVDPQDFRRRLGLRSTRFSVTSVEVAEAPPPPPPVEDPGVVGDAAFQQFTGDLRADLLGDAGIDPLASRAEVAAGPVAAPPVGRTSAGAGAALALAAMAGLGTIVRLGTLVPVGTADGVRARFLGVPSVGLARSAPTIDDPAIVRRRSRRSGRVTATMTSWRNRGG